MLTGRPEALGPSMPSSDARSLVDRCVMRVTQLPVEHAVDGDRLLTLLEHRDADCPLSASFLVLAVERRRSLSRPVIAEGSMMPR